MHPQARAAIRELGQALRERRDQLGMTQRGFADMVGIDLTYVSKIELGQQPPSLGLLYSLMEHLGCPRSEANYLLALLGRIPEDMPVEQRKLLAMHYPGSKEG